MAAFENSEYQERLKNVKLGRADLQPETRRQNDSAGEYVYPCAGSHLG